MNYGFCDLCVNPPEDLQDLKNILNKLYDSGYCTVAVNQEIDESIFDNEKKKKGKVDLNEILNNQMLDQNELEEIINCFKNKLKVLKRFTFSFSDPAKIHFLNQSNILKNYDLFALIPKTQNAFQYICSNLNADIILIKPKCCAVKINRKLYIQAVEKGSHFEIQYSDLLDTTTRKLTIHYSHLFFTFGKSKNVIISSGATDPMQIRNPYDIINLGRILGLNEVKAKSSILQQSHYAILKGDSRIKGKAIFIIKISDEQEEEDSNSLT